MKKRPSKGTITGQVWDTADRLTRELGRPAKFKEVLGDESLEGFNGNTVYTQYYTWKSANYPGRGSHLARSKEYHAASLGEPALSPSPVSDWAYLLKNGFTYLCDWQLTEDGGISLEREAPKVSGVYAFVMQDKVVYIGKTERSLAGRIKDYQKPGPSQSTNIRLNELILNNLKNGEVVRLLTALPPETKWNELPVITFHGLEAGLIRLIQPIWNNQGKG